MANKRNDNRHLSRVPSIYLIIALVVVVFTALVLLNVMPLWLAIASVVIIVLLFFIQLGALVKAKEEKGQNTETSIESTNP